MNTADVPARAGSPSLAPTERALPARLGDFEILEQLGQGGSGVVYAARHGEQEVALKVLRADEMPTPRERERFVVEAQHMARIRHPNVVRIFSVGKLADGRPFLAMERLRGTNLAQRIARGPLPLPRALELFEQLCSSVAAMHAAGLIHRDLKAENVMLVDDEKRVVLLDFGIARAADAPPSTTTRAGLQRGTPAVMAPERFFGARATLRSDIYELAVVFFVMVTGGLPWRDPLDPKARLEPLRPSEVGLELPAAVERVLMGAMSANVEERPSSVAEFAGDIRRAMQLPGVPAVGQGTTEQDEADPVRLALAPTVASTTAPVRARRLPIYAAVLAGLAVIGGAAVLVATRSSDSPSDPARPGRRAIRPHDQPVVTSLAVPDGGVLYAERGPGDAGPANPIVAPDGGTRVAAEEVEARPPRRRRPPARPAKTLAETATPPAERAAPATPPPTSPTPAATGPAPTPTPLPWCRKFAALYCTPEFEATEGSMRGTLCKNMREQVAKWELLPAQSAASMEEYCKRNFPQFEAAVKERLRMAGKLNQNDNQPAQ